MNHPLIATSQWTCFSNPEQWEGTLTDGRHFYYRYRYGGAWLGLGDTPNAAVDDTISGRCVDVQVEPEGSYVGQFESADQRDTVFAELLARHLTLDGAK